MGSCRWGEPELVLVRSFYWLESRLSARCQVYPAVIFPFIRETRPPAMNASIRLHTYLQHSKATVHANTPYQDTAQPLW